MSAQQKTLFDIVKAQFRKNRPAVWGLRLTILLFILAIGAPILAQSAPFAMKRAQHGWEFPWFRQLFDQNRWLSGVDLFFNLALVFSPIAILLWFLSRGRRKLVGTILGAFFLLCFFSMVGPKSVVESSVGKIVFFPQHLLRYSHPRRDFLAMRKPYLDQVLSRQKLEAYRGRLKDGQDELEKAEAHLAATKKGSGDWINAKADIAAAQDHIDRAKTEIRQWEDRAKEAKALAKEPQYQIVAIMPPIGYHHDDNDNDRIADPPSWPGFFAGWGVGHLLGTDSNGRDVAARILYGSRVSLTIGVIAVSIYCFIGVILGALMGFFGGWVDMLLSRVVEVMICFPVLPFILIIVAVLQSRSIFIIMVVIGIVSWPGVARLIRGQFLGERSLDYVSAARALGIPTRRIVFKHVLPNAIFPMFVSATFGVAAAILLESSLAFLGLGDPNVPSWGQLLLQGKETKATWLILTPGFAIFFTVTVLNLVGEGLRDALDPKLRQ